MFPANAGMILIAAVFAVIIAGVPRECGDDPGEFEGKEEESECSPRMRG